MIMGDLELIGKIIAQRYYFDADFAEADKIEHLSDTAVMSSDNQMFTGHKVMIESRWYDAPIYSTSATEFQMDLQIPAALVSLLINFLHFRPVIFPSLDEALDLFSFAFKISNQQLQKLCLDGIKEKMSPLDVLKVWNHSKPLRKHKVIIEYVTYHFPMIFGESEAVQNEFKAMPLNDAVQLLKLRKLNIQSEKDLVPLIMFYIQQNLGEKVEQNDLLKTVNAFMECFRIQKDRAKYVLPYLMDFNNINGVVIDCKVPSFNSLRRIPRDLFIFYGLYNKRNPIAYYIDLEAKKLCRMSTLDNSDYSIAVPNFCIANGILYQIGGSTSPSTSGFPKADCFAFDKHGLKWKRKSSILHERAYSNVCSAPNGSIFVVGGHSFTLRSRMKNVDIYDPIKNTWKSLPKMLNGRYHAGSIFYGGNLYVTGGSAEEHALGDCEYLPKYSANWVIMPQLNRARSGHQTVVYGQYLYVLGGRNVNEELSSVERLELGTNGTWREVAPMSFKRANFAAAVWDNKLFVFGGERDNLTQTVEYFDGENWHPFCSLPADLTPLAAMNWKNVSFADRLLKNDGIDSMIFATLDEEEDEEICSNNNNCCMDGGAIQGA